MIFIALLIFISMPKPSKKAKLNKPATEHTTTEPAEDLGAANPLEENIEVQHDDPSPMDHEDLAAPGGDAMENTAEPASPVRIALLGLVRPLLVLFMPIPLLLILPGQLLLQLTTLRLLGPVLLPQESMSLWPSTLPRRSFSKMIRANGRPICPAMHSLVLKNFTPGT